jgi:Ser/Thr protein kinase RdoA (MazF antagonist)
VQVLAPPAAGLFAAAVTLPLDPRSLRVSLTPEAEPVSPAAVAALFVEPGRIRAVQPLGNGQINDTYLVQLQPDRGAAEHEDPAAFGAGFGTAFVLQRLNAEVFQDPAAVIANHAVVEQHVKRRLRAGVPALAGRRWDLPELLPPREGPGPAVVVAGDHWRALRFIDGAESVEVITGPEQAHQVGVGLGMFHLLISDLPVERLTDTLKGFHVTPAYLARYDALADRCTGPSLGEGEQAEWQRQQVWCEAFIEARRDLVPVLEQALAAGLLPLRPIHGDPKVNNLLLDPGSGEAIALIDLDTVKPGLVHYDIGDCLRSGCNPLGEETTAFEAVHFDSALFEAMLSGYLSVARSFLTKPDWDLLLVAPRLLAFELGLRFYTDHLEGNPYFRTRHPRHNLDRALVQFHLVASIEAQQERLAAIVESLR